MTLGSIFADGFTLMRGRWIVYAILAVACAVLEWFAYPRTDIVEILTEAANGQPLHLIAGPPLGLVFGLSLLAQFAIIPSAVLRISPSFRLTVASAMLMIGTVALVGLVTDIGYVFAAIPGIVLAVLLSQVLIGVLVRLRRGMSLGQIAQAFTQAVRGSVAMTKTSFATTLGVLVFSLALLIVPFCFVAFWVIVLGGKVPASLVVTAPALLLLFVYLECARYSLVVRWYLRLSAAAEHA